MDEADGRSVAAPGMARARRTHDGRPRAGRRAGKAPVGWSPELGAEICRRVAAGALLHPLCREPGMPTTQAVEGWIVRYPEFGAALRAARAASGRPAGTRGQPFSYCEAVAEAIFERLCGGESLTSITRDRAMPSMSTVRYWRAHVAGFDDLVREGMAARADWFCDHGWELAEAATPETAYLTQVRLGHLRWMAGVMAPRVYRLKAAEPAKEAPPAQTILVRRFERDVDPATGQARTVSLTIDHEGGRVVKEVLGPDGWQEVD
jgi:hypothetical protein